MLRFLRRYWPAPLIAALLVVLMYLEWSHANGPREQSYAAAPQIPALAASQPAPSQHTPAANANQNKQARTQPAPLQQIQGADSQSRRDRNNDDKAQQDTPWWKWFSDGNHWIVIGTLLLAAAAFAQFELTRRTAKRQLRAYLLPESTTIIDGMALQPPQPNRTNIPGIVLIVKNSGQTPAYKVISWADIAIIPIANQHQLVVPRLSAISPFTLGAQCIFNKAIWFHRALTPQEITDIGAGTSAIYLYGRVDYRDAFRRKRYTNIRLFYTGCFRPHPALSCATAKMATRGIKKSAVRRIALRAAQ